MSGITLQKCDYEWVRQDKLWEAFPKPNEWGYVYIYVEHTDRGSGAAAETALVQLTIKSMIEPY